MSQKTQQSEAPDLKKPQNPELPPDLTKTQAERILSSEDAIARAKSLADTVRTEVEHGRERTEQYATESGATVTPEDAQAFSELEERPRSIVRKFLEFLHGKKSQAPTPHPYADPAWTGGNQTESYEAGRAAVAGMPIAETNEPDIAGAEAIGSVNINDGAENERPIIGDTETAHQQIPESGMEQAFFEAGDSGAYAISEEFYKPRSKKGYASERKIDRPTPAEIERKRAEEAGAETAVDISMNETQEIAFGAEARNQMIEQLVKQKNIEALRDVQAMLFSHYETEMQAAVASATSKKEKRLARALRKGKSVPREKPAGLDLLIKDIKRVGEAVVMLQEPKTKVQEPTIVEKPTRPDDGTVDLEEWRTAEELKQQGMRQPDKLEEEETDNSATVMAQAEENSPNAIILDEQTLYGIDLMTLDERKEASVATQPAEKKQESDPAIQILLETAKPKIDARIATLEALPTDQQTDAVKNERALLYDQKQTLNAGEVPADIVRARMRTVEQQLELIENLIYAKTKKRENVSDDLIQGRESLAAEQRNLYAYIEAVPGQYQGDPVDNSLTKEIGAAPKDEFNLPIQTEVTQVGVENTVPIEMDAKTRAHKAKEVKVAKTQEAEGPTRPEKKSTAAETEMLYQYAKKDYIEDAALMRVLMEREAEGALDQFEKNYLLGLKRNIMVSRYSRGQSFWEKFAAHTDDAERTKIKDAIFARANELKAKEASIVSLEQERARIGYEQERDEHIERTAQYLFLLLKQQKVGLNRKEQQEFQTLQLVVYPPLEKSIWTRQKERISATERVIIGQTIDRRLQELLAKADWHKQGSVAAAE